MDFLSSYTCRALRLKEDKWSRMMVSDEQRTYLSTFMDNSWPQARFFFFYRKFYRNLIFWRKKISKVSINEQWCNSFKFCSFNLEIRIRKVIQVEIIQTWVFDFYRLLLTWLALVWNFVYNALHEVNIIVWSASTHLTEYSITSFFILTLVLARTRVASTKRVTGGASFKLSK